MQQITLASFQSWTQAINLSSSFSELELFTKTIISNCFTPEIYPQDQFQRIYFCVFYYNESQIYNLKTSSEPLCPIFNVNHQIITTIHLLWHTKGASCHIQGLSEDPKSRSNKWIKSKWNFIYFWKDFGGNDMQEVIWAGLKPRLCSSLWHTCSTR